ncbi:monooxygenase [Mycobacterium tuberculosis]|nr:monooxygenase [Mycobacterium tuberculosis]
MSVTPNAGCVDVVIVGAGISGLGAAYRIIERNPQLTYTILERRARIGGTWDLFRYPGVRSDSSIFTLSFPYEPWTREEGIADGAHIREYLTDMAHKYGIDRHIEFNSYVHAADWGLIHRYLDRHLRAERRTQALPQPVRVLRQRLLQL